MVNNSIGSFASFVAAMLMPHQPILATIAKEDIRICTVDLWDINSSKHIGTLLEGEERLRGVGVDASGRYVVAMILSPLSGRRMITTALYDDNIADCLHWIKTEPTLLQRYLLMRLYKAHKNNDSVFLHPDSPEYRILQGLSNESCNIKEVVEKYLFKK